MHCWTSVFLDLLRPARVLRRILVQGRTTPPLSTRSHHTRYGRCWDAESAGPGNDGPNKQQCCKKTGPDGRKAVEVHTYTTILSFFRSCHLVRRFPVLCLHRPLTVTRRTVASPDAPVACNRKGISVEVNRS